MSAEAQSHRGLFIKVWIGLLVFTLIEIWLAYIHFSVMVMLTLLMSLSLVKAGMIMAYFMHLRRPSLSWILVVPLVACILIMVGYFFPDSFRILEYGVGRIQ
jgi:caa(3)-type oxidase subunit IV